MATEFTNFFRQLHHEEQLIVLEAAYQMLKSHAIPSYIPEIEEEDYMELFGRLDNFLNPPNLFTSLSDTQIARQDEVDEAIHKLMLDVHPRSSAIVKWDIEVIGAIRDLIWGQFTQYNSNLTEMEFYPYVPHEE